MLRSNRYSKQLQDYDQHTVITVICNGDTVLGVLKHQATANLNYNLLQKLKLVSADSTLQNLRSSARRSSEDDY